MGKKEQVSNRAVTQAMITLNHCTALDCATVVPDENMAEAEQLPKFPVESDGELQLWVAIRPKIAGKTMNLDEWAWDDMHRIMNRATVVWQTLRAIYPSRMSKVEVEIVSIYNGRSVTIRHEGIFDDKGNDLSPQELSNEEGARITKRIEQMFAEEVWAEEVEEN